VFFYWKVVWLNEAGPRRESGETQGSKMAACFTTKATNVMMISFFKVISKSKKTYQKYCQVFSWLMKNYQFFEGGIEEEPN